jgi:hypothetical protein
MLAMRLFTCFLQLLAGLALPTAHSRVRTPPLLPGSPDLPIPVLETGDSEITELQEAALLRMSTHFSGVRLDLRPQGGDSDWAVPSSGGLPWWGAGKPQGEREVSCLALEALVALLKKHLLTNPRQFPGLVVRVEAP